MRVCILRLSFHTTKACWRKLGGASPAPRHCFLLSIPLSCYFLRSISHCSRLGQGSHFRLFFSPQGYKEANICTSHCLSNMNNINSTFLLPYGSFVWIIFFLLSTTLSKILLIYVYLLCVRHQPRSFHNLISFPHNI